MPLHAGEVLAERYRIEALLGERGMGAVYRATDLRFQATVAVKENLASSPAAETQFEREARTLHELRHPNQNAAHTSTHVGTGGFPAHSCV